MKSIRNIILAASLTAIGLASCSETSQKSEFADWKERNEAFVDSLASAAVPGLTAQSASEGQLFRILSYTLDPTVTDWENTKYVYCRIVKKGAGTESPTFADSVRINYRARLIPSDSYPEGYVVDQSYKTPKLDPTINVPKAFVMSNLVKGMATALQNMNEGDIWKIYVPFELAYGSAKSGEIPAYSTVVFDLNMTEFAVAGKPLSRL